MYMVFHIHVFLPPVNFQRLSKEKHSLTSSPKALTVHLLPSSTNIKVSNEHINYIHHVHKLETRTVQI